MLWLRLLVIIYRLLLHRLLRLCIILRCYISIFLIKFYIFLF
nr:MAG TPA: hypothetical protein [Bacteriophage sp.]